MGRWGWRWAVALLCAWTAALAVEEEVPPRAAWAGNLFGTCRWTLSPTFPQFNDDYGAFQVNERLALGIVKGQPSAQAWAARADNSWQYPFDHPRRNKTNCLLLNNVSVEAPHSAYAHLRSLAGDFHVLMKRNVLVHETGIVAGECGYFQALEGCETAFKFIGRKWHQKCLAQLRTAGVTWDTATSPQSPLLVAPGNKSSPSVPVSTVLDRKAKRDKAKRVPLPARMCGEPGGEEWSYTPRLLVVSSVWDSNYHHFLIDVLPRLVRLLPFLRAHPDVLVHLRRSERYSKLLVGQRAVAMKQRVLKLLGLSLERFTSGPVVAGEVFVPRSMMCNFPVLQALEVRAVRKTLLAAARSQAADPALGPFEPFTMAHQPVEATATSVPASPKVVVVQLRHCLEGAKCDTWRTWDGATAAQVVQALRGQFPRSKILVANDSAVAAADCLACEVRAYHEADMLIGLHGAGMTNMMFMKPGGVVVEIAGQYDGRMMVGCGYHGNFASIFGVHHYIYYYDWRGGEALQGTDLAVRAARFFQQTRSATAATTTAAT